MLNNHYYFDTETYGLNPYRNDSMLLTSQLLDSDGNESIICEWDNGEKLFIELLINTMGVMDRYTIIYGYHIFYDLSFLIGRANILFRDEMIKIDKVLKRLIFIDLLQFNNRGKMVKLDDIGKTYGYKFISSHRGKHIRLLYDRKQYDDIVSHGRDDVLCLKYLFELGVFEQ